MPKARAFMLGGSGGMPPGKFCTNRVQMAHFRHSDDFKRDFYGLNIH